MEDEHDPRPEPVPWDEEAAPKEGGGNIDRSLESFEAFLDSYAIDYLDQHNLQHATYVFRLADPSPRSRCQWVEVPTYKVPGGFQEQQVPEPVAALLDAFRAGKKVQLWIEPTKRTYPGKGFPDSGKVGVFRRLVVRF